MDYYVYKLELEDEELNEYRAVDTYGSDMSLEKAIDLARVSISEDVPVFVLPISEFRYYVGYFNEKHEFIPVFKVTA